MIIDNGRFENVVSTKKVHKLKLESAHPDPYKLCQLQKGYVIKFSKRRLVSFSIRMYYNDEIWYDVVPMDACHLLLGIPQLYDKRVLYNGFKHAYAFENDGYKIVLASLKLVFILKGEVVIF